MLRHVVLIRLRPDATPADRDAIVEGLRSLPAQIPEIQAYEVGTDAGLRPGNPEVGLVALFADEAAWRTYLEHPAHVAVVSTHIAPVSTERISVQFTV
jgi:hypothetical protein